jgi:hypothetical protein
MKRIPAGILLATLVFTAPAMPRLHAEENAEQLSQQQLGSNQNLQDTSAQQLSNQQLGTDQNTQDTSAQQLSNQQLGADQNMQDTSAQQLSNQQLGADQNMQDESAKKLAKHEGLESKAKKTGSAPTALGQSDGVNGTIYAVVSQPDGAVIIGGRFDTVNGLPRLNLARFKADGTLDTKFLAGPTDGVDGTVYALALDAKGNLLVGGYFSTAQDQPLQNFVRYLSSGSVDPGFNGGQGPNGPVYAVAVLPKGKIVIGGEFTQVGDVLRKNIARYKANGMLDDTVTSANNSSTGAVRSLAALGNGGILAGGKFNVSGDDVRNILRTGAP